MTPTGLPGASRHQVDWHHYNEQTYSREMGEKKKRDGSVLWREAELKTRR